MEIRPFLWNNYVSKFQIKQKEGQGFYKIDAGKEKNEYLNKYKYFPFNVDNP